ncbi:DUF6879 family protein [Streptomyces sp. NPDC055006]
MSTTNAPVRHSLFTLTTSSPDDACQTYGRCGADASQFHQVQVRPGVIDAERGDDDVRYSAWRLESRRRYASDESTETYREFLATGSATWDPRDPYAALIRPQIENGRTISRVRILDEPPTVGQRYLLDNARRNSALGEEIKSLNRADADRLRLPAEDFWIFDSRLVAKLNFTDADELTDVELITEPVQVVRYSMARDAAWHHAVPYEHAAAQYARDAQPE